MKILNILFLLVFANLCFAETILVKLKNNSNASSLKKMGGKVAKFTNYKSAYFNNLYSYEKPGEISKSEIQKIKALSETETVEVLTTISSSSIDPADIRTSKSKDPFYIYQWGLDFQNQKVFNERSDIENVLIKGDKEADVSIGNLEDLSKRFKKDKVVVAIIDTGVDFNHPDLKNNINLNEDECENGEIPYEPEAQEGDNYPGDCKGWNFTGKKEGGTNRPEDFVGHGTHLAGIISATRNNNIGLSGISNKIKILPIKVLSNAGEDSQAIGTSDRLSKAILYAIEMKADVINLSLGWPLSFDKEHLKNAVLEAVRVGVTVVAAAGNNDHSEPIMPCGYEGVICVGSSDPNLKISDFSNYGAHVDVLAPGNNILSTYPIANTPLFFDFNGYEIKSGTSQATPYVSALVATIKGIYPEASEQEVKARVLGSYQAPYKTTKKFVNGNLISFSKALGKKRAILKPNFKGFNRVRVNPEKQTFTFDIHFNDFDSNITKAKIQIAQKKHIVFDQNEYELMGDNRVITINGKLANLDLNLLQKFSLEVSYNDIVDSYSFEKRFYLEFSDIKTAKKYQILGANPKSITQMSTLNQMHHEYDFPYYYTTSDHKKGLIVSLFTRKNDKIMNVGTTILPEAKSVLSIHRVDANLDGVADILVRSLIEIPKEDGEVDEQGEVEKETTIMYSYLSEKMRPLFSEMKEVDGEKKRTVHSHMKLKFEGVILQDLGDFAFGKTDFGKYGKILVPVYMTHGQQPEADTNPNPFARLRRRVFSTKLYFYEPAIDGEEVILTTRTINNNKFTDRFKKLIKFRPFEQIFMVKFKRQSFEDIKNGKFSLLISHESERKLARNYVLSITDLENRKWELKKLNGSNLNLSLFVTERAHDLTANTQFQHDADLEIVGYEKSSRLMWEEYTLKPNRIDYVSIVQDDVNDSLEFPIKTYFDGNKTHRFFLTPSRIYLETRENDQKETLSFPVHVSSFLPGMLFREQHYPISYVQSGKKIPALYVDSTQIASRNIYMITTNDERIYAPIKFNLNIPENCKALNPVIIEGYKYEYSIQCFNKRGTADMIFVPLESE